MTRESANQPSHRRPQLSAHNWHGWSMPPGARVSFDLAGAGEKPVLTEAQKSLRTAAESIVDLLCKMGLDTFFGLPGGQVIPVFDAILTHPRARLIEPRHETYGTFAAMGYHRATNRVPVVVVTSGPGATNVVTGVVAAHVERVPMLVICGDTAWAATGRKMFQDTGENGVGIERMLKGVARAVIRIAHPNTASSQTCAAVQAALDPDNPGPALVVLSIDQGARKVRPTDLYTPGLEHPSARPVPCGDLLRTVADRLHEADRPLILIGAGCRRDIVGVRSLIETLGTPFVTTPQAKGLLPEDHPLSLRNCGVGSSPWARRYMNQDRLVTLVLGSDLDDMSTAGTPAVSEDGELIHIDNDASIFNRNFPAAIAATYHIGSFAEALAAVVRQSGRTRDRSALIREARAGSPFDISDFAASTSVPIAPHRAIADLERAAGPDTTFVSDIGEHMLFALHYLTIRENRRFMIHLGLGSMGSGIASAVGLALGEPSRRVICICGDGGMQMAGMEILVAIKLRLPIVYAIFNDARYNMVYHGYRLIFSREAAWETPIIDFAKWAESLGARGRRVERPGEITKELLDSLTDGNCPAVLDIRHDAEIRVSNGGRVEAVRKGMGIE